MFSDLFKLSLQVLLYDFFSDSPAAPADWKALCKTCLAEHQATSDTLERDHAILQMELKCLYVGLTRAREHVWIWDSTFRGEAFEVRLYYDSLEVDSRL